MVQGYYTLDESAQLLGISADELKQKARKGEIRSFQDRGTWRFRIQDIQELARASGRGSDPDLPLGDALKPKGTDSPAPRSPSPKKKDNDIFAFSLGDDEPNAASDVALTGPGSGKKTGSDKRLLPGSDSDVRLVSEGSDINFHVPPDSDVKIVGDGPKSGSKKGLAGPNSPRPVKFQAEQTIPEAADSGVRLVPIDSDSDVRIVGADADDVQLGASLPRGATDSDIRLESAPSPARGAGPEGLLTEEINLDEELKKDEARRQQQLAQAKKRQPEAPKASPFELSESDLELEPINEQQLPQVKDPDGSSDFDLTPAGDSSSPLELGSSDDFQLEVVDDDDALADDGARNLKGPASGINLGKPADSGISLEQGDGSAEDIEFELTLDAESTPRPSTPKPAHGAMADSDSEFELSLDLDSPRKSDSDSEFELTLDDAGGLGPLEVDDTEGSEDKDIFETDFEVPALEESGSDAVAMDDSSETDLESSDFELAVGDEDVAADDESGSQVVALDEEEAVDDAAETVTAKSRAKKRGGKQAVVAEDAGDFAELDDEPMAEADDDMQLAPAAVVKAAPWGVLPVLVLFPCVLVMILVGIMGFELVQTQQGYRPGLITRQISGLIDKK